MTKVFFSYSHKDEDLRNELETHLALLKRQDIITSWHDRRIDAGQDVDEKIRAELETADIVVLLISAHFLASDYCYNKEMRRALERHDAGECVVVPIILHPCDWKSAPFGHLRATPTDGKPVSMYANQHEAFEIITRDIRRVAETVRHEETDQEREDRPSEERPVQHEEKIRSSNLRVRRTFDDHERDEFLDNAYEYVFRFFDGSLKELESRNRKVKARIKRTSDSSFSAFIYEDGKRAAECSIRYEERAFGTPGILYSHNAESDSSSFNENLCVVDDGYTLQLKAMGLPSTFQEKKGLLSKQGAAEYLWSLLISPLQ